MKVLMISFVKPILKNKMLCRYMVLFVGIIYTLCTLYDGLFRQEYMRKKMKQLLQQPILGVQEIVQQQSSLQVRILHVSNINIYI